MTIALKVIGIFFDAHVHVDGPASVKEVLDAAQKQAASGGIKDISVFDYTDNGRLVTGIRANHTNKFTGRITTNIYESGEYFLASNMNTKPSYTVWQYYVLNNKKEPVTTGFKPFNSGEKIVPEGGFLIWRLVSVLHEANPAPRALKSALEAVS